MSDQIERDAVRQTFADPHQDVAAVEPIIEKLQAAVRHFPEGEAGSYGDMAAGDIAMDMVKEVIAEIRALARPMSSNTGEDEDDWAASLCLTCGKMLDPEMFCPHGDGDVKLQVLTARELHFLQLGEKRGREESVTSAASLEDGVRLRGDVRRTSDGFVLPTPLLGDILPPDFPVGSAEILIRPLTEGNES